MLPMIVTLIKTTVLPSLSGIECFGTFQPEVETPIYGITKKVEKPYSPLYLVFHEWADLLRDFFKAKGYKAKLKVAFGPPRGDEEN